MLLVGGLGLAGVIKVASDLEEQASKFEAVFKDQADEARAWIEEQSQLLNRSQTDLMKYMATLQDTFVPFGFARDKARELAQGLTQLAVDLASFHDEAEGEVIQRLTSALGGHHEAVRRFGIVITEATLKSKLFEQGITRSYQEVTALEKLMARMAIIYDMSTDAQGDAIRTGESFANQLRGLTGQLKETAGAIGAAFLDDAKILVKNIKEMAVATADWAKANEELARTLVYTAGVLATIMAVLPALGIAIQVLISGLSGLTRAINALKRAVALGAAALSAFSGWVGLIVAGLIGLGIAIDHWLQKMMDANAEQAEMNRLMREQAVLARRAAELTEALAQNESLEEQKALLEELMRVQAQLKDPDPKWIARTREQYEELMRSLTEEDVAEQISASHQRAVMKYTEGLQLQIDTFGMAKREAKLYALALKGLTEEQKAQLIALDAQLDVLEENNRLLKEAEKAAKKLKTEEERKEKKREREAQQLKDLLLTDRQRLQLELQRVELLRQAGLLTEQEARAVGDKLRKRAFPDDIGRELTGQFEDLQQTYRRIAEAAARDDKDKNRQAQLVQNTKSTAASAQSTADLLSQLRDGWTTFESWLRMILPSLNLGFGS
jgi:hypothetical protein